jgi:hypothetical protein
MQNMKMPINKPVKKHLLVDDLRWFGAGGKRQKKENNSDGYT